MDIDTSTMTEIELGMSNFDNSIDDGLAEKLMEKPGAVFGRHAAWNFNGKVFYSDGRFHEEVWCYHSVAGLVSADTLEKLMEDVNDEFGWD